MKVRDFKKLLFADKDFSSENLKKPGNNGRVDIWKSATQQSPLIIVIIKDRGGKSTNNLQDEFATMICSTDVEDMTDEHGKIKTGIHAPNPVKSYTFVKWFESNYSSEFNQIFFKMDGKTYKDVSKIKYDRQSGNIDIYLGNNKINMLYKETEDFKNKECEMATESSHKKYAEKLVSEILTNKNVKAQNTLNKIIRLKTKRRIRAIEEQEAN